MLCECVRSCKFYPKMRLASGFMLTRNSRTVTLQDLLLHKVTSGRQYTTSEVTSLVRKIQKITNKSNFKRGFLRTADRIAAKFYTTNKKIKPHDIIQNYVHSTRTLSIESHFTAIIVLCGSSKRILVKTSNRTLYIHEYNGF